MKKHKPFVIGLVGGIAAGKSFVARTLERMGAVTIDADKLGHQVLARKQVADRIAENFGKSILAVDGTVDRRALAERVFGNSPESVASRTKLEQIVHPLIHAAAREQLQQLQGLASPPSTVVIDAPLLLEANWAPMCDAILFIDCPHETRVRRAAERGWTLEQYQQREAAQMPLEEKKQHSTHVIQGDVDAQELERQLRRIVEQIIQ